MINLAVGFGVFCLLFLVIFGLGHLTLLILDLECYNFEDVLCYGVVLFLMLIVVGIFILLMYLVGEVVIGELLRIVPTLIKGSLM